MKVSGFVGVIAVALCLQAGAADAQSFKATRDFSYLNPGGVWSYGYGTTGAKDTFTRFGPMLDGCGDPEGGSDCFRDGEGLVATNLRGKVVVLNLPASSIVIPSDALQLHTRNDGQDTIVQFKTPATGSYRIEGYYQILDNRPTGIAPRIFVGAKDVTLKAFGATGPVVLSGPANPEVKKGGEKRKFSFTQSLRRKQDVHFGLNANGTFGFDSTAFEVKITPVNAP